MIGKNDMNEYPGGVHIFQCTYSVKSRLKYYGFDGKRDHPIRCVGLKKACLVR